MSVAPWNVTPWNTRDADELLEAGWQWCATNRRWWRTTGPDPGRGACSTCLRVVLRETNVQEAG